MRVYVHCPVRVDEDSTQILARMLKAVTLGITSHGTASPELITKKYHIFIDASRGTEAVAR